MFEIILHEEVGYPAWLSKEAVSILKGVSSYFKFCRINLTFHSTSKVTQKLTLHQTPKLILDIMRSVEMALNSW